MSTKTKAWVKAASIRAIKTMAQSALGMMTLGMSAVAIDWINILSVAVVAGAISILTSLEGLPEVTTTETTEVITGVTAEAITGVIAAAETTESEEK